MDTRGTTRTRESEMEDTAAESPPEMAEVGSEQPGPSTPALLRQEGGDASAERLRLAHSRLAELLYAAAAALEEITRLGAGGAARDDDSSRRAATFPATPTRLAVKFPAITTVRAEGGAGPRQVTAEGQAQAVTSSAPASASTSERPAMPCSQPAHTVTSAGSDGARSAATDVALQQRLPPLKEFVGADGDWGGFKRRFIAHQEMANWTDDEALRALPAMLDNDALATLTSAPMEKRATLHLALQLLSAVYGPPSDCRQLFHDRHRGANESPLAFRTALLALAKAAFPRMDEEGVDAMVAEKLLLLADELDVAVLAQDDAEMSSLLVARHIHGGLRSLRRKAAKGVAGHAMAATTLPSEEVCGGFDSTTDRQEVFVIQNDEVRGVATCRATSRGLHHLRRIATLSRRAASEANKDANVHPATNEASLLVRVTTSEQPAGKAEIAKRAPPSATVRHRAPPCATVRHRAPPCATVRHRAPPCATIPTTSDNERHRATPRSTSINPKPTRHPAMEKERSYRSPHTDSRKHRGNLVKPVPFVIESRRRIN
ncbi:unnamed protein product [Lampetra planeri]